MCRLPNGGRCVRYRAWILAAAVAFRSFAHIRMCLPCGKVECGIADGLSRVQTQQHQNSPAGDVMKKNSRRTHSRRYDFLAEVACNPRRQRRPVIITGEGRRSIDAWAAVARQRPRAGSPSPSVRRPGVEGAYSSPGQGTSTVEPLASHIPGSRLSVSAEMPGSFLSPTNHARDAADTQQHSEHRCQDRQRELEEANRRRRDRRSLRRRPASARTLLASVTASIHISGRT